MSNPQRLTNTISVDLHVEQIAKGGFGTVYMGPNRLKNDRWYALKTYQPRMPASTWRLIRDRFVRETIISLGIWPHPNLLSAITVLLINQHPYILLEYAEGGNLRSQLQYQHRLSTRLRWAQMIASGLLALHTPDPELLRPYPIVHRDLKPENILFDSKRVAKISDFGLARVFEDDSDDSDDSLNGLEDAATTLEAISTPKHSRMLRTERGVVIGTPPYMAPELWVDANFTGTYTDVYAFGVILSELFAGRYPWSNALHLPWPMLHATQIPGSLREVVPELPGEIETLYYACMEKRPENRPTASEILTILQQAADLMGEQRYSASILERTPEREGLLWNRWAIAYKRFVFFQEAFERSQHAVALLPDDAHVLATHVGLLMSLKRYDEAKIYASHGMNVAQNDIERADILKLQANLLQQLKRYPEADVMLAQSLTFVQYDADTWKSRGTLHIFWARTLWDQEQLLEVHHHLQLAESYIGHAKYLNKDNIYYKRLYEAVQAELHEWEQADPWMYCQCHPVEEGDSKGELRLTIQYNAKGLLKKQPKTSPQELNL